MSIRKGNDIIASTPAVDTVPQQGSANVITSGAVYTSLQDYVTLSTSQTITGNKAFNGATISTNSDIEFTSVVAGLISNRNGTKRNLITRTNFNEVNVGNPYDPTIILGSGVRPHYNTIEYLALYSDIPGNFTGATAGNPGTNGLVPAPAAGDEGKFLQGDGTWTTVDALPDQTGHSGEYLTTDGSTASWAPASGEPDNSTITKNASDKLQAVAVIDQNAGGIVKTWKGTLAEYNLLGTYSNDTEYIVTDDETGGASVYTKAEVDTLLSGKVSTGHELIAYQNPTSGNNYTWYRKYADGWVEQGGVIVKSLTATNTSFSWSTSLPVAMANSSYTLNVSVRSGWTLEIDNGPEGVSTTGISGFIRTSGGGTPRNADIYWHVSGLYA